MPAAKGAQAGAKEDTVFLAITTLTTDLSQVGTDLTSSAGGGYELNSTRAQLITERTVTVRWTATAAEANKAIFVHGKQDQSDMTWAIGTDGTGIIVGHQNGAQVISAAAAVGAKDYTISWSMRANPLTTGASDAKISELVIYNHTNATIEIVQATHVAPTSSATWDLSVGGWWDGANLILAPTNAPTKARVSSAAHPNVEEGEDWVAARTAYAGDSTAIDEPIGPLPISSGLGDQGQFAGRHPWGYAGAHAEAVKRRCWAPLVNEVLSDAQEMTQTPAPAAWAVLGPGSTAYTMMLQYLRWTPIPLGATYAWVRVHVVSYVTAGAAVPIGVRMYAMNRPPAKVKIGPIQSPALKYYYKTATLKADHGVGGTGAWLELGWVRLPRFTAAIGGWTDTIHLALAYDVDPASASTNDANERLTIDAWHVRPDYRAGAGVIEL